MPAKANTAECPAEKTRPGIPDPMSGEFEVASNDAVFGWLHPARVLAAEEAGKINSKLSRQDGGTGLERPSGGIDRLKVGNGSAQLYDDIRDTPSFSGRPAFVVLLMRSWAFIG
nr:hypothetical protein OG781_16955 [Streptomyces sp. NBC_00830]